jgi:hypothetical protein
MKDLGETSYVFDIEIHRDIKHINIVSKGLHSKKKMFEKIWNEGFCTFSSN